MIKSERIKKIICFLVPNLLYVAFFSYFYNRAYSPLGDSFEILFEHIGLLSVLFFVFYVVIYALLRIKMDYVKTFFITLSLILLSFEFIYESILMWIIVILFNIIMWKLDNSVRVKFVFLLSYVVVMLFLFNFPNAVINSISLTERYTFEDVKIDFNVDNNTDTPNIYWIHCDAMINLVDAKKYFNYDNGLLEDYLKDNNFNINENATFFSGGHTIQALVSLYNPRYYDVVFEDYLNNINKKEFNSKIISYDMLTDKRFNNELFKALKLKGYSLVTISDFNQYASFYTDYMFDYYSFQKSDEEDLDFFTSKNNTYDSVLKYNNYAHIKTLLDTTFLHYFTDDYNFLSHEEIEYNSFDFKNYENIDNGDYWKAKAMLKSLDLMYRKNQDNKMFTFIDFDINHTPWLYDVNGKKVNSNKEGFLIDNFLNNYEYSTKVLIDLLKYIKDNDENAVIVLQSDHGIHTVSTSHIVAEKNKSSDNFDDLVSSTFSAVYVPEMYLMGDESYLDNPMNISRYLINNFVGQNYEYVE